MPTPSADHTLIADIQSQLGGAVKTMLVAGGGLIIAQITKWFKDRRERIKLAKQSDPSYLVNKHVALDQYAQHVCDRLGADHMSLYQFHNGEYFSNGNSIRKMSMVSEAVSDSLFGRWKHASQNLPCLLFTAALAATERTPRVWLYPGECEDFSANKVLSERGYTCAVALLVKGNKGVWLGLLVLAWGEGRHTDETIDTAALEVHRREFAYKLT